MAFVLSCGAVPEFIRLLVSKGARQPTVRKADPDKAPRVFRAASQEVPGGASVFTMKAAPAVAMGEYVAADGSVHSFADVRGIQAQGPGRKSTTCTACGKAPQLGVAHLICSGCKLVSYCGPGCQREHWKRAGGHKDLCKRLQARTAAGAGTGMGIDLGKTEEQS